MGELLVQRLLAEIEARRAAMPPEERRRVEREERLAQRESWVRAMTTPCEHGVLDFEQCGECRARSGEHQSPIPSPSSSSGIAQPKD